jgi:2-oxoglutarate dehydrogenase E2 component (dihydrolipoamide succinyltransferase)
MIIEVKVPQLSESVAEATLAAWHVKEGDAVARDQNLIDIETDKVVLELPAPDSGVIVKIIKNAGESVVAGEVIAQIDTEAKGAAAAPAAAKPGRRPPAPAAAATATAMPAARKIMDEKGIAASDVQGSGRGGRILKEDVSGGAKAKPATPSAAPPRPPRRRQASPRCRSPTWSMPMPSSPIAPSSACRCRACAPASPSAWCSRNRPTPS